MIEVTAATGLSTAPLKIQGRNRTLGSADTRLGFEGAASPLGNCPIGEPAPPMNVALRIPFSAIGDGKAEREAGPADALYLFAEAGCA